MITKDGRDTPIKDLTSENYLVPKGEEMSYHVIIENVRFDSATGKRLSKPRVQKFGKKSFETQIQRTLLSQGYTITILHDPNEWIAEHKVKAEQARKAKYEADVAAEVARQLAKMKAEGTTESSEGAKKPGRPAKAEK